MTAVANLAAQESDVPAADPVITVHVDEAEGAAGGEVSIYLRTYAPRPLGQGQLCIVVRRSAARRQTRSGLPAANGAASADEGTPFVAFLGGEVFSDNGDAAADFLLRPEDDGQELRIDFASPTATVNTSDLGPLARLDFRLRDDLAVGDVFELELDLARSLALDAEGLPVPLGSAPGRLFVVEPGTRAGAGLLRFEQRTFAAAEGTVAVVAVERVRGSDGDVEAELSTFSGTATPGDDYTDRTVVLSWRNGELGSRVVTVPVAADARVEATETVDLALGAVGGGARVDPERSTAVLALLDVPAPAPAPRRGAFRVASASYQALEGSGELVVAVERFGSDQGAVAVELAVVGLSAEAGLDFAPATGSLAWSDGESGPKDFRVELFDDDRDEGLELAEVRLLRARGGAALDLERSMARLEIVDDDAPEVACVPGPFTACLQGGRFLVRARWRDADGAGPAWAERISDSAGVFWFFSPDNAEILFKVLDACSLPSAPAFWVAVAAATPLQHTVVITDVLTGVSKEYGGTGAQPPSLDAETFRACP